MISLLLCLSLVQPQAEAYRALFLRAAPGRLMELLDLVKARRDSAPASSRPVLLRHAQGDQWDLMLLQPVGSLTRYFATDHTAPDPLWDRLVAWQEELFVSGPPAEEFRAVADRAGYFHLEIFVALAGKRDSLTAEREMENRFLTSVGKPGNFVFNRTAGASWDLFTVGFYRDLQQYAEPSGRTPEQEEAAARAAGFASRESIGPYLRRFINGHHDTIGPVVRVSRFEIVAAAFGIVSVFLSTRQNIWSWPTSLVNVTMYGVYFLDRKLYALMTLQVFFGVISLYGWYEWLFGGQAKTELKVTRTPPRQALLLGLGGVASMLAIWLLLSHHTADPSPGMDAGFFAASLVGQYMMARKYVECWPLWIAINCVSVPFFYLQHSYPTMVQYAVFLGLAIMGWRQWKASLAAAS